MFTSPKPTEEIRQFVAHLRESGYVIGLSELNAIIQIALLAGVQDYRRIEKYWRALASSSHKQWEQFPMLFEGYWFPKKLKGSTKSSGQKKQGKSLPELIQEIKGEAGTTKPGQNGSTVGLGSADNENDAAGQEQGQGGASKVEPLAEKPLGEWMPEEK